MSKVVHLNDDNFEGHIARSEVPVLVDFSATWCGPCKALNPLIEKMADELDGKFSVCKVDVDEAPESSSKHGIRGVPTLILFKGGKVVATHVGGASRDKLNKLLETV
jgi:thioredoxin 1